MPACPAPCGGWGAWGGQSEWDPAECVPFGSPTHTRRGAQASTRHAARSKTVLTAAQRTLRRLEDEDQLGELFAEPPALAPILPAPAQRLAPAPPLTGTHLPSLLRSGSAFALGGGAHPPPLGDCGLLACEEDLGADLTNRCPARAQPGAKGSRERGAQQRSAGGCAGAGMCVLPGSRRCFKPHPCLPHLFSPPPSSGRHTLTPPRATARGADAASSPQLLPRTAGGPSDSPPLARLGPLPSAAGAAAVTALAPTWHSQQVVGATQHLATSSRRQLGPPVPTSAADGLGLHDAAPMPRPPKGGGLPTHRARAARAEAAVAPSNTSIPRQPPVKAGSERQAAPGLTGPAAATPASSAGRAGGAEASSGGPARSVELTLEVLEARGLFDMPLQQAARKLGVGVTTLKK